MHMNKKAATAVRFPGRYADRLTPAKPQVCAHCDAPESVEAAEERAKLEAARNFGSKAAYRRHVVQAHPGKL